MKKIFFVLIILLSLRNGTFTQGSLGEDFIITPFWDFYTTNYLSTQSSGRGFTGIASVNDISGILLNPASINIPNKYQINVQYTYKTRQQWLPSINLPDLAIKQQLFSGSIGFGYRINKQFQTGFIYNNPSSLYFNIGPIIQTNEYGNEIGRYDLYYDLVNHSFNVPFVYTSNEFSLGLNLNYLISRYIIPRGGITTIGNPSGYSTGDNFSATASIFKAHAGFIYNFMNGLSIGATVSSGGKSTAKYKYPDGTEISNVKVNFPWKAGFGFQYSLPKTSWKISADYNYTNTSVQNNLKDRHDFHFGVENVLNNHWTVRGGFFTLLDYRNNNLMWLDPVGDYNQYFLTLGTSYQKNNFIFNLAVLTSQISTGIIKNTYVNAGLTFNIK